MTLVREYQPTFVLGDGETKEFSYLFEEVSENFIKVIVKHSDDSTYTPVFSVDLDSHKVVFGESETAPLDTDIICIYRETPDLQDTPFRTLQGYDAKALENILSKIVAMIQELKANGFSTQILQGTPWQLDLLHPADDGASVVVDYNARILKKGLYFQIVSGNLQVSADGNNFIKMPKSADITEFRRLETVLEDLTVQYRLQYKVDGVWYNAESAAQVNSDWNANSGIAQILNKPTIPTVNNPTITITQGGVTKGSFTLNQSSGDTIALDAGGGGSIDAIDGVTITKNGDDEIQAVATVNQNTAVGAINPVYDWVGTLAEYNAQDIENQHPDWICYITDDVSGGASVYTKTEVDNNFVEKGHEVIAFQAPTSANNYTWYRKYKDGWVEQGGCYSQNIGTGDTAWSASLPVSMSDNNYTASVNVNGGNSGNITIQCEGNTSTVVKGYGRSPSGAGSKKIMWRVEGMAA